MNVYVAFSLFALVILVYFVISELFTMLFRFAGLPGEKARFQVTSILTGCGFTTKESEIMLTTRTRRRLGRITMLFGYAFNITIVSAFINVFLSLKIAQIGSAFTGMLIPLAVIVFIFVFTRIPAVHSWGDRLIERLAGRIVHRGSVNTVMLIDYIGQESIALVTLQQVPEPYDGVPLSQTGLKSGENILVLHVERNDGKAVPATANTVFIPGDKLTIFGNYKTICRVFNAKESFVQS